MFLLLKYQKLLTFLVTNPKKKLSRFSRCFYMESPYIYIQRERAIISYLLASLFNIAHCTLLLYSVSLGLGAEGLTVKPCLHQVGLMSRSRGRLNTAASRQDFTDALKDPLWRGDAIYRRPPSPQSLLHHIHSPLLLQQLKDHPEGSSGLICIHLTFGIWEVW